MIDPKIFLLQDNCFAIKRWVEPETWGPIIREIGFDNVEASFDNEMDFFYTTKKYREQWFSKVEKIEKKENIKLRTFFTGYQTYRTSGLAHPDMNMSRYLIDGWVKPAIQELGERNIGMGFALHAYPEKVLQNPDLFKKEEDKITQILAEIAQMADENGKIPVCIEAMYAPHQTPWTIEGTKKLLKEVYQINNKPIYTTIDVGHMIGQIRYRKPTEVEIIQAMQKKIKKENDAEPWLGADHTYKIWDKAIEKSDISDKTIQSITSDMDNYPYLFSYQIDDSDPYAWLKELGCYSPIIHMQQTDGITASHAAFTPENNKKGIIDGKKFLLALSESYTKTDNKMPPKVKEINLAFEIFASNAEHPREIIKKLKQTCEYWKQYIPKDGILLSELVKKLA